MGEEYFIIVRRRRLHHHLHREGFVGQTTLHGGGGIRISRSSEQDCRRGGDTGMVGDAEELEVIILIEVITGYRFIEPQQQMVAYTEDGIRRFGIAEHTRRTGVFRSTDNRRSLRYKSRTVAAEADGAQVILLLHRVPLTVETELRNTSVLNHRFIACSECIEAVAGVERTLVHPFLLALRGEFILELDMVEVLMMDIESADVHRQVVSDRIVRREGIHHPVLTRHLDADRTGFRHEVRRELQHRIGLRAVGKAEIEGQVVVVIHFASFHLQHLSDGLSRREEIVESLHERCTVDIDLRAVRVAVTREGEREGRSGVRQTVLHLSFVLEFDMEDGALIRRHTAYLMAVDAQFRQSQSHRPVVDDRTFVVELRLLLFFVYAIGSARLREEDVRTVKYIVVVGLAHFADDSTGRGLPQAIHLCPIDRNGDIALRIRHDGETAGFLDGLFIRRTRIGIEIQHGIETHRPFGRVRHRT